MATISQTTVSSASEVRENNVQISIRISLFVPKVSIDKIAALVQIMAWRRTGDKPLSESMMS